MRKIDETGNKYNKLTVIEFSHTGKRGESYWVCHCDCGNVKVISRQNFVRGSTVSCGCYNKTKRIVDLTGKRFGKLLVVGLAGKGKSGITWDCICDCGKRRPVTGQGLRSGDTKSCGCMQSRRAIDLTGRRFGILTVLRRAGTYIQRNGHTVPKWLVRCDCGKEKVVIHLTAKNIKHHSCGCTNWNQLPSGVAAMNDLYSKIRAGARKRKYCWELTKEQFREITSSNCSYCGIKPSQVCRAIGAKSDDYIYNGIDRVDNSKGYTIDNVVPCCGRCNGAKSVYSIDEFKEWISVVYHRFFTSEQTQTPSPLATIPRRSTLPLPAADG